MDLNTLFGWLLVAAGLFFLGFSKHFACAGAQYWNELKYAPIVSEAWYRIPNVLIGLFFLVMGLFLFLGVLVLKQ